MSHITPLQRKMLECIVELEGGFKSKSRDGTRDPMTLFGVIDSVWARLTHQPLESARREMKAIGLQCEPYPKNPQKYQAHNRPHPGISDRGLTLFNEGREKAINLLHAEYLKAPGFDQYPEFIQLHLLDFGINKGPARARWALVDAMLQTGILKKSELANWYEAKYETPMRPENLLSAASCVKDESFRGKGPGSWYCSADTTSLLELHLRDITPSQQAALIKAYGQSRTDYYNARVSAWPAQKTHLEGWLKRVNHINACALADLETPQPQHHHTPATQPHTPRPHKGPGTPRH